MKKNLTILLLLLIIPVKVFALIEVDITRGNLNPLPLAVSPLAIDEQSRKEFKKIIKIENIGSEISNIVENNLKTSGLFNPLSKDAFLQAPEIANLKPRFEDWNLIKAQALITGKVSYVEEKLRVEFRLWDVLAGKEMMALAFTTSAVEKFDEERENTPRPHFLSDWLNHPAGKVIAVVDKNGRCSP